MNIYDENLSAAEMRLISQLKNKNRMEKDQIIGEYENGNTLRNDNTSKKFI